MNLEDYAYNEDGRWYVNPQVSLDEQNAFIDNYRNIEAANNAEIASQTRALGTQAPTQLGGLTGAGSYFRSRYQTPQTNATISALRSAAQQQALSEALNNELAKAKALYQKYYRNKAKNGTTSGYTDPEIEEEEKGGDKLDTVYKGTNEIDLDKFEKSDTASKEFLHGGVVPALWQSAAGAYLGGIPGAFLGAWHGLRHGNDFWNNTSGRLTREGAITNWGGGE